MTSTPHQICQVLDTLLTLLDNSLWTIQSNFWIPQTIVLPGPALFQLLVAILHKEVIESWLWCFLSSSALKGLLNIEVVPQSILFTWCLHVQLQQTSLHLDTTVVCISITSSMYGLRQYLWVTYHMVWVLFPTNLLLALWSDSNAVWKLKTDFLIDRRFTAAQVRLVQELRARTMTGDKFV